MSTPRRRLSLCGRPRRRGNVLVLVAMLLLGLLGLAALVIDVGLARLTQAQMQCAVDAAALEGLRSGRQAASDLVARAFDDDLDLATEDDRVGAGPVLEFDDGLAGELHASRTLQRAAPGWKPTRSDGTVGLELNLGNATHGDLVAGTYSPRTDLDGDGVPETRARHVEDDDYERDDFTVADAVSATGAPAFLVRLRRTPDLYGLDREAGVSAGGPALPFLFGLGTAIQADPAAPGGYQPRRDGLTVRATAIAELRPVRAVGGPESGLGEAGSGLAPLAFERGFWEGLAFDVPTQISVDDAGRIEGAGGVEVGRAFALEGAQRSVQIGQQLERGPLTLPLSAGATYAVVLAPIPGASDLLAVGFGRFELSADATLLTKRRGGVTRGNGTPGLARGIPTGQVQAVLDAHRGFVATDRDNSIWAPALVR